MTDRSSTRTGRRKVPYRAKLEAIVAGFLAEVVDAARRERAESNDDLDALDGGRLGIRQLRALQSAIEWQIQLETGQVRSSAEIASREGIARSAVTRSLRLLADLTSPSRSVPAPLASLPQQAKRPIAVPSDGRLPAYRDLRSRTLREFETEYVHAALRAASGNLSMAARIARVDRKHLWRLLRRTRVRH